ncbi:prepilin-type N-terminal cleavage/methylation domain-containing protein, partial [Escherichia coli]
MPERGFTLLEIMLVI